HLVVQAVRIAAAVVARARLDLNVDLAGVVAGRVDGEPHHAAGPAPLAGGHVVGPIAAAVVDDAGLVDVGDIAGRERHGDADVRRRVVRHVGLVEVEDPPVGQVAHRGLAGVRGVPGAGGLVAHRDGVGAAHRVRVVRAGDGADVPGVEALVDLPVA